MAGTTAPQVNETRKRRWRCTQGADDPEEERREARAAAKDAANPGDPGGPLARPRQECPSPGATPLGCLVPAYALRPFPLPREREVSPWPRNTPKADEEALPKNQPRNGADAEDTAEEEAKTKPHQLVGLSTSDSGLTKRPAAPEDSKTAPK